MDIKKKKVYLFNQPVLCVTPLTFAYQCTHMGSRHRFGLMEERKKLASMEKG